MNIILKAFIQLVDLFLTIYVWIIIARAIISWVNPYPYHPVVRFLYRVTEPVLAPLRRIIPPIAGIDITPAIVIFIIFVIQNLLHRLMITFFIF
ncbi:MAG: Cytochrome b6 maturation protein CCB3/Ycf19 [Thermodesulfobacterium sp.]|uniref:Cytochrome b6 maturation protein CCB3/Ycf19 n=1 Tax=Candidatus Thermodesulfobacterium syntrophicum TaxID=3060442 RepID=A0AAE3P4S5_9BACT|nr:Cytochrome b6 maturation protein CCB3/Ycf19 [Candidatus Thermodesulfobacterium syntrophicum]